jgi:hypothetical protein
MIVKSQNTVENGIKGFKMYRSQHKEEDIDRVVSRIGFELLLHQD